MATKLPRQIQAQLDAAEALLNPPPAPPAPEPEPPAPPPEPPIVEPPTPQPPAPAPATPQPDPWEHKYKVLQGMFNQRDAQLKEAMRRLDEVTARLQQPTPPAPAPTAPPEPSADPKDVNAFGEDMMEMVHRVTSNYLTRAGQVLEARIAQIETTLKQLHANVQGTSQTVAATAEELFFEKLTELAPEWDALNTDQGYLAWLAEQDPITGIVRHDALKDAFAKGDARRAATIFKAYRSTMPPPPAAAPPASPTPRAAGTPPPTAQEAKPMIRQAEIVKFYDDVRRGIYRGREQERQQLEAQYNAAIAEGRIV
jgi:hypothetical protein